MSQVNVTARMKSAYCERGGILPHWIAPSDCAARHEHVDESHEDDAGENRAHLIRRIADADDRLYEIAADAEEQYGRGRDHEHRRLDARAGLRPRHHLPDVGAPIQQE